MVVALFKEKDDRVPLTETRTDHSIKIRAAGQTIGRIQDWSPQQSRNVEPLYELNSAGKGAISEHIPAVMTGQTISITRVDLYLNKMEEIWGLSNYINLLCDQHNPFTVNERWDNPDANIEMWSYTGCWFTSLGRNHSADGDKITKANATMVYTNKKKVSDSKIFAQDLIESIF